MMKKLFAISLICVVGYALAETSNDELTRLATEDYARMVRPAWENGGAFWNLRAMHFMYPPAFNFTAYPSVKEYDYRIIDDQFHFFRFRSPSPNEPLTNVWSKICTGLTTVICDARGADGKSVGLSGVRHFWKSAPFKPGAYPPAKRPYAEAAAKTYEYIFNLPPIQTLLKTGKPDPTYKLNCYPTKIGSALISAMVRYAKAVPEKSADALKLARAMADYLIAISEPAGAPLGGMPPTYETHEAFKRLTAVEYAGQTMMLYPADGGNAYLDLFYATDERKYRDAALTIAERYLSLQGEDGSWYLKLYLKDGKPVTPNRCHPTRIAEFLERVYAETKDVKYRAAADRAFTFVEKGPLADWNWEGQFEDVDPTKKYLNLTKYPACEAASYMLSRFPEDQRKLALARELLRFSEDQFVNWERPCRPDGTGILTHREWMKPDDDQAKYLEWLDFPNAMEQYYWYIPIDASTARLICTYLALYRATKNPLDLAKAKAMGDTLTRVQFDSGRIPTELSKFKLADPMTDWLNCMIYSACALEELAHVE